MSKNIYVSNSGSYQPISVVVDDNMALSSSISLTINTASFVGQSGIMQIRDGQIKPIPAGNNGEVLIYTSSQGFIGVDKSNSGFKGDLSGSLISGVKVINISNVTGGVLSSQYGGTSANNFTSGSLVTTNGSGPVYEQSDQIVAATINGEWIVTSNSILGGGSPTLTGTVVYLYTGSISATTAASTSSFIWNKPGTPGSNITETPRFIRIICQGAGGGGGGTQSPTYTGGSGGGYSDILLNASEVSASVTCSVGNGGIGTVAAGGNGGSSSFGNYIKSYGGIGGYRSDAGTTSDIMYGYLYNGGAAPVGNANGTSVFLGGASGGAAGLTARVGGSITSMNITASTIPAAVSNANGTNAFPPGSGSYFAFKQCYINNNTSLQDFPALVWAGGTTGGRASTAGYLGGTGSAPQFGSGGGGGGLGDTNIGSSRGGNGGRGYILIICS